MVQVQIDYLQIWIPPDKSFELLLSHGIPDPLKLELRQPGETVEAKNAVVSVVWGGFAGVETPEIMKELMNKYIFSLGLTVRKQNENIIVTPF